MYILLCGYAPFSGNCGLDCGWERGESCRNCQEMLFASIKDGEVVVPVHHWGTVSRQAKDLILHLLVRDSNIRLDAEQVLDHPWILNGGSTNALLTPTNLKLQTSIKDLEDLANRVIAVNRAFKEDAVTAAIPLKREAIHFNLSPLNHSSCSLLRRRRKSKCISSAFSSIDGLGSGFLMRTIC